MRFFLGIVAILTSLIAVTAVAKPVVGLYQVREELPSQETDVRDAGLQQAFVTLMQRLTGQANAADSAQLAAFKRDPQALISRYGYEGNTLVVNFDPQTVQSALRETQLPLWGSNRPVVLTWWLIDDLNGQRLVSDGQSSAQKVATAAQYYGVPVRMPLGDLADQMLIGHDALARTEQIRESVERYSADSVLLVKQTQDGAQLLAQWQLWIGDEYQQGDLSADSEAGLERAVFAQVNQQLAQRFAVKPGEGHALMVRVAAVDLERFVQVERLLEPFAVQLHTVDKNYVQWQVNSSVEQLKAQMALGGLHEQTAEDTALDSTEEMADTRQSMLYFGW